MKINVGLIHRYCTLPVAAYTPLPHTELTLRSAELIGPGTVRKDAIYIGQWADFHTLPQNLHAVACIGGGDEAASFFLSQGVDALIFEESIALSEMFSAIQQVFSHFNDLERKLLMHIIGHAGTRVILNVCAEFFEAHVALYGQNFKLLDYSDVFWPTGDTSRWDDIVANQKSTQTPLVRTGELMQANNPDKIPKSTFINIEGTPRHFNIGFDFGYLRFATMIVTETASPLDMDQHWLMDYVTDLIKPLIVERYNGAGDSRNNLRTIIVKTLNEQIADRYMMKNGLEWNNWKLSDLYRLLVISLPKKSSNISHYLYNYENVLADEQNNVICTFYEEKLILVMHEISDKRLQQLLPRLERQLELDDGVASLGLPFCQFEQLSMQYNIATMTLEMYAADGRIVSFRDIMARHLVNQFNAVQPLHAFCHVAALRVYEYDKEKGTDYLLTLETYLKCNRSLQTAADMLFIHKSTLTYRLKSLKKIADIDYEDPDERFNILLSCIVLKNIEYHG